MGKVNCSTSGKKEMKIKEERRRYGKITDQ